jgi:uncharacterized protein YkwD
MTPTPFRRVRGRFATLLGLTALVAVTAVASPTGFAAASTGTRIAAPLVGHTAQATAKKTTKKVVKKKAAKKAAKKKAVKRVSYGPRAVDQSAMPTAWLARVNAYRAAVGSPPVTAIAGLSAELAAHARYLVRTGASGHDEDPSSPYYSDAGAHAGSVSDVLTSSVPLTDADVVDQFIAAPFHAFALLDPQLAAVAFGSVTDANSQSGNQYAALLDVIDGQKGGRYLAKTPAVWPSNGSVVNDTTAANEWPNPSSNCPGGPIPAERQGTLLWAMLNQLPAGLLQAPPATVVRGATLVADDGTRIPLCVVTQQNWRAGDPVADQTGRIWLKLVDGVILVPLHPLAAGMKYRASIIGTHGTLAAWSFNTAADTGA